MPSKFIGDLGPNPDGTHGCPNCGAPDGACQCMPPELGDNCPECGAPPDMPHDPRCPNAEQMEPDPDRYREATDFDRFMDVTLFKESKSHGVDAKKPSPQRLIARKYQEHPLGKIRIGGK